MVWDLEGFDYPTEVLILPCSECGTALERVVRPPVHTALPRTDHLREGLNGNVNLTEGVSHGCHWSEPASEGLLGGVAIVQTGARWM